MPDAGPDMSRLGLSALAMIVVLGLTILGMRLVGRLLEPSDARRALAVQAVLWIGTAVLVVILLLIRH
jgi:hypothetical protein